jgi:uncharacterized protein (TIGR02270 family)
MTDVAIANQPVVPVIHVHTEESATLRNTRMVLMRAPHVRLHQLRRLDDRLGAHLDGLSLAGEFGWKCCEGALEDPGVGEVFAATVRAIEDKNAAGLQKVLSLAGAVPKSLRGLASAFGWVSPQFLQGTIKTLLTSGDAIQRRVGIAACAMHRTDPGPALDTAIKDPDPALRARALKAAGELGRADLLDACRQYLKDDDAACRFYAAWSATLLGDRAKAVEVLLTFARTPGEFRDKALQLALKTVDIPTAHAFLKEIAADPASARTLIQGTGVVGDPYYVPWLIKQMADQKLTRLAGESFSFITGLDLAYLDLERKPPENFESGPNDDPKDENVAMDEDDGLPWPDPQKIAAWWEANKARFPNGTRYFMGDVVSPAHCVKILKDGFQRQRIAAALYLSLINPGTALFEWRAPAWRQQRLLAQMS